MQKNTFVQVQTIFLRKSLHIQKKCCNFARYFVRDAYNQKIKRT